MNKKTIVQIIGAPIACCEKNKDGWREAAEWTAGQLMTLFGDSVGVTYFDLFDIDCPTLPAQAQLPIVLIDNEVVINGGKISIPLIRRKLQELGLEIKSQPYT